MRLGIALLLTLGGCAAGGVGAECLRTEQCASGLQCAQGICKDCGFSENCATAVGYSCADSAACGEGRVCFNATCYTACTVDTECDDALVCLDDRCVPGCRNDAECAATQLCLEKACQPIDPEWLPKIAFTPTARTIYVGEPTASTTALVTPGTHDSAPILVSVSEMNAKIARADMLFTLTDTSAAGNYSITVTATGRAGTATKTYVFEVRADQIYAYMTPVDPDGAGPLVAGRAGIYAVGSDGLGLAAFDDDAMEDADAATHETARQSPEFGFLSRPGKPPAYYLARGQPALPGSSAWDSYELRTGPDQRWFSTTSHKNVGDCVLGANTDGVRTCVFPLSSLSTDATGRRIALQIGKLDPTKTTYLFDLAHRASAVVVIDTNSAPGAVQLATGTDPASSSAIKVFSSIPEGDTHLQQGEVPRVPNSYLTAPSLSSDGERLMTLHATREACPVGGNNCGANRVCSALDPSIGTCESSLCLNDTECLSCARSISCTLDSDCPQAGTCVFDPPSATSGFCSTCQQGAVLNHLAPGHDLCCVGGVSGGTPEVVGACSATRVRSSCCTGPFCTTCRLGTCENEGLIAPTGPSGVTGPSGTYCGCVSGEMEDFSPRTGIRVCRATGGGFCAPQRCIPNADPTKTSCPLDSVCVAGVLGGSPTCRPKISQRYQIYDSEVPGTPLREGPQFAGVQQGGDDFSGGAFNINASNLFATLMANERVVFFSTPGLEALAGISSADPDAAYAAFVKNIVEVRIMDDSLNPSTSTLLSPKTFDHVYQSADYVSLGFVQAAAAIPKHNACLATCDDPAVVTQDYVCSCPSTGYPGCVDALATGESGAAELPAKRRCCRVTCFDDCKSEVSGTAATLATDGLGSGDSMQPSWCDARVADGSQRVELSAPYWTARDGSGTRLLMVQVSIGVPFTGWSSALCDPARITEGFCGAAPTGPQWDNDWGIPQGESLANASRTRLLLIDINTGATIDLLDSDDFRAYLLTSGSSVSGAGAVRIGDPHFVSGDRQIAFFAQGAGLKDPNNADQATQGSAGQLFVVNADGSNLRRVLDQRQVSEIRVPGYGGILGLANCQSGCGSCGQARTPAEYALALLADWTWLLCIVIVIRRTMRVGTTQGKRVVTEKDTSQT